MASELRDSLASASPSVGIKGIGVPRPGLTQLCCLSCTIQFSVSEMPGRLEPLGLVFELRYRVFIEAVDREMGVDGIL